MKQPDVYDGKRDIDVFDRWVYSITNYHWGRGPMETGVYMLGTFQSLAESSSNVIANNISFTFQM